MNIFKHHNSATFGNHPSTGKMNDNDTPVAFLKICVAWFMASVAKTSTFVLSLTLAEWVQIAALLFTLAQLYFLLRDKWWRDGKEKRALRRLRRHAQYDRSNSNNPRA